MALLLYIIKYSYVISMISNKVVVTRQPNWPQMFSGESITLTCEVQGGETTDWTCEWRRDGKTVKMGNDKHLTVNVNESSSEEYMCQCRRRDDWHSTNLLNVGSVIDPVLTVEPNWSTFYAGEFVTFICDMNEGRDTDWQYRLIRNNQEIYLYQSDKHFRVGPLFTGYSGEFHCCGNWTGSCDSKCSKTVTVTVSDRPRATLTAGSTTIPVGGSVTLSCSVEPSAGWKYRWFRRTSDTSFVEFSRNNEENREITVTQGGIYKCDGKRGNPSFYSHSITVSSSSHLVLLISGPVVGFILIILLVLLCFCRRSKGETFFFFFCFAKLTK
uniref:Ig-like domain-containing protein n=1 Tax=Xiphophorus maculatus TaxID=8083 RepID=A0A3B5R846_XIPMA